MTKANPYDLKKIVNDEKYAKDNHFKVKKSGELFLIKYIKSHINSENICSFGRFRSVITDGKNIISMAPQKSYKFEDFKLKNKRSDCMLQEFIEGTMINCFYFNKKWIISTRSIIGADCKFNKEGKSFLEMFNEALDYVDFNLNSLDPKFSYSFVLQHPENRIVVPFTSPSIYLVEIYFKQGLDMVPQDIYSDTFQILKKNFKFPAILYNNSEDWKEIKKQFENCDYKTLGCIIKNKMTNERSKIRNNNYEFVRQLRGNNPKIQYVYYNLRKNRKIGEFLRYFPEYKDEFAKMQQEVHDWTNNLYQNYRNCFVKKEKKLKEYDFPFRIHMYNLHQYYLNNLKNEGYYIDRRTAIEHVNNLDPAALMYLINFKKRN